MDFAVHFARFAGRQIVSLRTTSRRHKKLDRTDVTDADISINEDFIQAVTRREGRRASVIGEELSRRVQRTRRVWTIDPIDGTGEYVNDSVPNQRRTTCTGICLMHNGVPVLSVVYNPFRVELFTASRGGQAQLNGRQIRCSAAALQSGVSYDYSHWSGSPFDLRNLENRLGRPRGVYSAIYQACEVAAGRSAFAAFPGNTIHDIAPGSLLVACAGGRVSDLRGEPLRWNNLSRGALYAAPACHQAAVGLIAQS